VNQKKFLSALLFLASIVGVTAAQTLPTDPLAGPLAPLARGNRTFAKADYEGAIREYRSVTPEAGETYAQALYNIGVSYYELWRTADAIDYYRQAIAAQKGHYPRASYSLGVALEDQGKSTDAKEAYQQALVQSRGEYAAAHYRLGLIAAGAGEFRAAAEYFRKALKRPGLHVPASHNNLGVMLAKLGRLQDAQHEFEIALRQSDGTLDDAVHNLKLCHSLLAATVPTPVAAFRVCDVVAVLN
jgi:tetratricopeptide (TPR) repeat protein